MSLSDLVGAGLEAPVAAIRRYAISFAIAASAAIGSLCYLASAATRALELSAGPIGARLIVGLALAAIAIGGYFAPRFFQSRGPVESAQAKADAMTREQKIGMVLEALRFGFSMGSRKPAPESSDSRK
jgi:hypothetical protein